ncbi:Hypothetical protein, putative [Bodo saltans]|uniref:Uncharacterized protein n=1 Tax=Bodo saltans TaxID=75058 RepID=A0A0S4IM46_BODSA|nr:Hypothetical protein, putative [Bodo saltans]|eukprot:CUE72633.1 Hypothetical protein, putative [Bodo saltans]
MTEGASHVSETHTSDIASAPGDAMRRSVSWQRADGSIRGLRVGHTVTIVGDARGRKQNSSFRSLVASPSKSSSPGMQATNPLARSQHEHSLERIDRTASTSQHSSASFDVSTRMPTNPPANHSDSIFLVDDVEEQPETFVAMQLPECWAVKLRDAAASADA